MLFTVGTGKHHICLHLAQNLNNSIIQPWCLFLLGLCGESVMPAICYRALLLPANRQARVTSASSALISIHTLAYQNDPTRPLFLCPAAAGGSPGMGTAVKEAKDIIRGCRQALQTRWHPQFCGRGLTARVQTLSPHCDALPHRKHLQKAPSVS